MEFRVLTLRYCPTQGAVDDGPLIALGRDHEVLSMREHFFMVRDVPHLLCVLGCRPRSPAPREPAAIQPARAADSAAPDLPNPPSSEPITADDRRLYDIIRAWRNQTAHHDGVPPYVVLTNRNVEALVRERPQTPTALAKIRGIGKAKVERYGEAILRLLSEAAANEHRAPVPDEATTHPQPPSKPEEPTP